MTPDELKLKNVQTKVREHRASDFLSKEQMDEVRTSNIRGRKTSKYNAVDSYIAEILARFGYDTYMAWKAGNISEDAMAKYIMAERAREAHGRYVLESVIVGAMAGANNPDKYGHAPKPLKTAIEILKSERKLAEGN